MLLYLQPDFGQKTYTRTMDEGRWLNQSIVSHEMEQHVHSIWTKFYVSHSVNQSASQVPVA